MGDGEGRGGTISARVCRVKEFLGDEMPKAVVEGCMVPS